jgi:L-ascorbate metabolism protein UlaG (beta-lactamase superfamily)
MSAAPPGAPPADASPDAPSAEPPGPDTPAHHKSAGLRRERTLASARYRDGVFHNTHGAGERLDGGMGPVLREWLFGKQQRRPPVALPVERPHEVWARPVESNLRATWLGHSTVLLELDGRRVLTDPVFAKRIGPASFVGPRRFHPVPAALAEVPPIDVVLLSHDHYDHLCAPTMRQLARRGVPIVTALGVGAHLERLGFDPARITELDWFEAATVGGVRFTATPAQHFSGRAVGGRNRTQWASWVIEAERTKVFFSGDTGLTDELVAIGGAFGPFDLVMLEIGAFHPAWGTVHLGPENALEAFRMLGGGTLFPVHWGTFSLGLHAWNDPGEQLLELAPRHGARILTPRLGSPFEPAHVEGPTPWWREVAGRPAAAPILDPGGPAPASR